MEGDYITRREHEAFKELMGSENERIKDENERQNHRIGTLEKNMQQISRIASNTERLAANMENMLEVQKQQGNRLEDLEKRDGELWRKVVGYVVTAVIGILLGFVFKQIGM